MDRRRFMGTAAGFAAGMVIAPRMGAAAEGVIDWYTGSDSNVLDFWANTVKPAFEAANPGITINLVDAGDNAGLQAIGERADGGKADEHRSAGRLLRELRSPPCPPARSRRASTST